MTVKKLVGLLQQHLVDCGAQRLSPFFEAHKNLGSMSQDF